MKRLCVLVAPALILMVFACAPRQYRYDIAVPIKSDVLIVGVGDEFFRRELMYGEDNYAGSVFNGDALMFTLTVVALDEKLLSLQYREFTKHVVGPHGGFRPSGGWLIKDGYSQKYDYNLSLKTIKFRDYEFEVLGVKDGRIQYKRIF